MCATPGVPSPGTQSLASPMSLNLIPARSHTFTEMGHDFVLPWSFRQFRVNGFVLACLFVCLFLGFSQQFFSHVGTELPGLNQY